LLAEECFVQLAANGGLEVVGELHGAKVLVDSSLDLGDAEIRQVFSILSSVMFARGQVDVTDPPLLLRHDLAASAVRSIVYGAALSLLFSVIWVAMQPLSWTVLLVVFLAGILAGMLSSAGGQWYMHTTAMIVVGLPPWRFMDFLSDAHAQGVLRQHGGSYEFRHALLQERLAANFAEEYVGSLALRSTTPRSSDGTTRIGTRG
jgi:hypothetical protein